MTRTLLHWATGLGLPAIGLTLWVWGQPIICTCGYVQLWVGSIFSSGNSQHVADWYTLSHVVHGMLIGLAGWALARRVSFDWIYAFAIFTGVGWEIIEHTNWVLDAFRATTINQGYLGDSVLNAMADFVFMMGGFFLASAIRPLWSLLLIVVLELTATFVARDSLTLSTLSLVWPIQALDDWQQELNPRNSADQ
ncbi:DUF2585 family protein [Nioella aestuarii]|uniref:DUF2585 family protein n=1 Tax=Nioella aestuarii TaxID=1662864 RepID=UPI003D7F6165